MSTLRTSLLKYKGTFGRLLSCKHGRVRVWVSLFLLQRHKNIRLSDVQKVLSKIVSSSIIHVFRQASVLCPFTRRLPMYSRYNEQIEVCVRSIFSGKTRGIEILRLFCNPIRGTYFHRDFTNMVQMKAVSYTFQISSADVC